jgi:protein-S-isoprenylcysteine O-methyltransferase Ste14
MKRIAIFGYGLLAYLIFTGVVVYGVGFIGGFWTPTMLDAPSKVPVGHALMTDLALLAVFALQHSGMARPAFKRRWVAIVPQAAERSTYVLVSSLALGCLYFFWEPIGREVWHVSGGPGRHLIVGLNLFGWALLLYATFLIDHFDLFGLRQVWRQLCGKHYREPAFRTPSLYKLIRHPIYVGWLTIFWAAPTMTLAHLVFTLTTSVYILLAIRWEERDLVSALGQAYADYKTRTPMLVPRLWGRRRRGLSIVGKPM